MHVKKKRYFEPIYGSKNISYYKMKEQIHYLLSFKSPYGIIDYLHTIGSYEITDSAEIAFFPLQLTRESTKCPVSQIPPKTINNTEAHSEKIEIKFNLSKF